jgi:hypothetical protein
MEVDCGDRELAPLMNRLEADSEQALASVPSWLGEQYGERAIVLGLDSGYLTDLVGLAPFGGTLRVLSLDHNRLESLGSLPRLTLLEELSVQHNRLSDLGELVQSLRTQTPALRSLAVRGNPCAEGHGACRIPHPPTPQHPLLSHLCRAELTRSV